MSIGKRIVSKKLSQEGKGREETNIKEEIKKKSKTAEGSKNKG